MSAPIDYCLASFLAMDDIEDSIRQASILGHLSQQHTGSRILLTWLHDKGVAYHSSQREHLEGGRGGS